MQNYEKTVAQALYACIRAGKLDEAIDLTKKAQQPWRAAVIRGSALFQWRGICAYYMYPTKFESHCTSATEPRDESDDDISTFDDGSWRGNKRRRLWKSACIHGALNVGADRRSLETFAKAAPKVKPPRPRAGVFCLPSSLVKDLCGFKIGMSHVGGFPVGSSKHYV